MATTNTARVRAAITRAIGRDTPAHVVDAILDGLDTPHFLEDDGSLHVVHVNEYVAAKATEHGLPTPPGLSTMGRAAARQEARRRFGDNTRSGQTSTLAIDPTLKGAAKGRAEAARRYGPRGPS